MKRPPRAKSAPKAEGHGPGQAPVFRPLEEQLRKIAQEKKAEDARAREKERAAAAKAPVDKKGRGVKAPTVPARPSAPRPQRLTADEQQDLAAMSKAQQGDDEFFFHRLMSGVVPLGDDKRGRVTTAPKIAAVPRPPPNPERADPDDEVRDHLLSLVEGAVRFEVNDDGKRLEGRRLDLDAGTWRRVRRGELPVDARLDLHGLTAEQARTQLETFMREKRARHDRLVLVIHGRGEHSPAGIGVLRGEISAWLSQGRSSQHVAAFATARDEDGGEGAVYVLLRP